MREVGCPVEIFFYMPAPRLGVVLDPVYLKSTINSNNYELRTRKNDAGYDAME